LHTPHLDCPVAFCVRKWAYGFIYEERLLEHLRKVHHWDIPTKQQIKDDENLINSLRENINSLHGDINSLNGDKKSLGDTINSLGGKIGEVEAENGGLRKKINGLEKTIEELETKNKWLERRVLVLCGVVTDVMRLGDDSAG
jgi:chromosome segregation ATPase